MAMQLSQADPFGVGDISAYGRLVRVELDVARNEGVVHVAWFRSAEARAAGKNPFKTDRVVVSGQQLSTLLAGVSTHFDAVKAALYSHVCQEKYPGASQV